MTVKLFDFYAGRSLLHYGWEIYFAILPMRELMTKADDEGRMVLTAAEVLITFPRSRTNGRWCRPSLWFRSDAAEIAQRRSETVRYARPR